MKYVSFFLSLLVFQSAAFADGGETQNGGGAAEQNFAYALAILKPVFQMCLATDICVKTDEQRTILTGEFSHLDEELAAPSILQFDSAIANPGRFFLDGQVRIAVTGLTPASTIYVNRDMIYRHQGDETIPYTVSEAIGVLTHELGHHQGVVDHDRLDVLAGNVRAFFELSQDRLRLDTFSDYFDQAHVVLNVFHTRLGKYPYAYRSHFWLDVEDRVFDLNEEIKSKLSCPMADGKPAQLMGFRFSHLGWGDASPVQEGSLTIPLDGRVWLECNVIYPGRAPSPVVREYLVTIQFPFVIDGHKLRYSENKLQISLEL